MSLRARLLASVATVALVALVLAEGFTYTATRAYLGRQLQQSLTADSNALQAVFAADPQPSLRAVSAIAPGAFVQLRSPTDQVIASMPAVGPGGQELNCNLPAQIPSPGHSNHAEVLFSAGPDGPNTTGFRVLATRLADGDQLVVGLPLSGIDTILHHLLLVEVGVVCAALLAAILLGWWLVHASMRPLRNMERTAGLIASGDVQQRVVAYDPSTEVGQVAAAFNSMLDRIQAAFAQRDRTEAHLRRFVADASHELRTPLSAVSAYAELSRRGPDLHPDDRDRALAGISAETARMSALIDELLLLARLDQGRPLSAEPVELVGLTAEAVNAARAVGPDWPISLQASFPVEVVGDRGRLRQVIDNLLANVQAHTPPGTQTRVHVGEHAGWAVLEVADTGPGLGAEDIPRVFERFYRAESSRSRQRGGGSGLGLAIAKAIVEAHRGTITVSDPAGQGAIFVLWLPLPRAAPAAVGAHRAV